MNLNPDPRLADRITRELQALGELPAPPDLAGRVLRSLQRRAAAPWYRRAWTTWPPGLQGAAVGLLAFGFVAVCWVAGAFSASAGEAIAAQQQTGWWHEIAAIWNLCRTLGSALVAIVEHFGTGLLLAVGALLAAAYAACVCLGTAYVRFAMNSTRLN